MPIIATNQIPTSRAIDFFYKTDVFFGIGGPSAWADDNNPPAAYPSDTITNLIGVKQMENIYLVVPDVNGTITYQDSKWSIVPPDQAKSKNIKHVYVDTTLMYDELPLTTYRQVGLYTKIVRGSGVREVETLQVTGPATSSGVITVTLAGSTFNIAISSGDTTSQIAAKVASLSYSNWTTNNNPGTSVVTFTSNMVGSIPTPAFSSGSTGVLGNISTTTKGSNAVPPAKTVLLPSEIGDLGFLEILDNRTPTPRARNQRETLSFIIQFS
ncbi:MAG: hypothetical protein Q8910_00890 [Bacteroidota bacterium]|nr:hypothetical protein [Bacteroidota bacterium]